ncbi:MAG: IPT/TIG domain-containing protein [Alphaproteobacteria bacterium]|nr:IPT/TIG domain-containing protein [Alphaproteobacteria bacterium]
MTLRTLMLSSSVLALTSGLLLACGDKDDDTGGDDGGDDTTDADTDTDTTGTDTDTDTDGSTGAVDADGDGYDETVDCDDTDAAVNPGADEVCDDIDNDCDDLIDDADPGVNAASLSVFYADADGDNFGLPDDVVAACAAPSGYGEHVGDCDDAEATTYPGAPEVCDDEVDQNCNIVIDCDDTSCGSDALCAPIIDRIEPSSGYFDVDTSVTIRGLGFDWETVSTVDVQVGDQAATDVVVVDNQTLTAVFPKVDEPMTVDVTITTEVGSITKTDGFDYVDCVYLAEGRGQDDGMLYCLDIGGGTVIAMGSIGDGITSLAWSPDGTLYGTSNGQSGRGQLYTIDQGSGAGTAVGTLRESTDGTTVHYSTPDATFVGSNLMAWTEEYWGSEGTGYWGDELLNVDTSTGATTVVGESANDIGTGNTAMAADADGLLFLAPSGTYGPLYLLDPATSDYDYLGYISGGAGQSGGMTFHEGELYMLECDYSCSDGGGEFAGPGAPPSETGCTLKKLDLDTLVLEATDIRFDACVDAVVSPDPGSSGYVFDGGDSGSTDTVEEGPR